MFDIGAPEVLVIMVVALFVFGPDRLPTMARQAGRWIRDLRRMVANARRDLDEHIGVDTGGMDLRDLDPRSYIRRNVLDGLDLDDDASPGPRQPERRSERRPERRPAAPAPRPPYDPDAT